MPQQSPKANKAGTGSRTSVSGGGVLVSTPRRRAKGRAEADFEAATVAMKSKFEGQPGECVVMVVVVNGVRPQPPRAPRSLEGYCIMVSGIALLLRRKDNVCRCVGMLSDLAYIIGAPKLTTVPEACVLMFRPYKTWC